MVNKKDLIIVGLSTFCLTSALFMIIPTRSSPEVIQYDPWADINDDGIINYQDIYYLILRFMEAGEPINKTELLLELQAKTSQLESDIVVLQAKLDALNGSVQGNSAAIADLQADLATLQGELDSLESRISVLEGIFPVTSENIADGAVTALKLAAGAIPYASAYAMDVQSTTSTTWADIPSMSVSITISRPSHLLIMFSTEALCPNTDFMVVRALVDTSTPYPSQMILMGGGNNWEACSTVFFMPNVGVSTYTINMQWRMIHGDSGSGYVEFRSLTVIALPQ